MEQKKQIERLEQALKQRGSQPVYHPMIMGPDYSGNLYHGGMGRGYFGDRGSRSRYRRDYDSYDSEYEEYLERKRKGGLKRRGRTRNNRSRRRRDDDDERDRYSKRYRSGKDGDNRSRSRSREKVIDREE